MPDIFNRILRDPEIVNDPPVLIDIGASEEIHPIWKDIAAASVCIAFDADTRDFNISIKEDKGYKKLYKLNTIVTDKDENQTDFYLTESPYCSSTLLPREKELADWAFADKFKVTGQTKLNSITLSKALSELGLNKIDWYKSDSQGTDLRLFKSLPDPIRNNVLVAEFEPGFIDSYQGEDKLYQVLQYLDGSDFWLSGMLVKGSKRITPALLNSITPPGLVRKLTEFSMKTSPGWAELCFINNFNNITSRRDFLLGWLFSSFLGQHGFAFGLAEKGNEKFQDKIFTQLRDYSVAKIKNGRFTPSAIAVYFGILKQKLFGV